MILTLICKKREADGKKWTNYTTIQKGKWYNVKFVKECAAPQIKKIDENINRAFIELNANTKFDIKEDTEDKRNAIIFIESYNNLSAEALQKAIDNEFKSIEKYREEKEKTKISFLMPTDDTDCPFEN